MTRAREVKEGVTKIFKDAKFTSHKWHSNALELEESNVKAEEEETFAKQ